MGSIGNKRGSVRQAPPDVYMGFMDGGDEESWEEVESVAKAFLGVMWWFVWAIVAWVGWTVLVVWD